MIKRGHKRLVYREESKDGEHREEGGKVEGQRKRRKIETEEGRENREGAGDSPSTEKETAARPEDGRQPPTRKEGEVELPIFIPPIFYYGFLSILSK